MIKMQIIMDSAKIEREKSFDAASINAAIDSYLVGKLGLHKSEDGFYLGDGGKEDFSNFGLAFNTLRKKEWFVDNVKTWLYFNSDASENPDGFGEEDFKKFCLESLRATG